MLLKKLLAILFIGVVLNAQELPRYIEVNGVAETIVDADYISFTIDVRNVDNTLDASKEKHLGYIDKLVVIFKDLQIEKKDYEITPIRYGKEYSYEQRERKLAGFYSTSTAYINLRNTSNYYNLIDRLSEFEDISVRTSQFKIEDELKYHKETTIKATKAALEKAKYLAKSVDLKVGTVIQIIENQSHSSVGIYPSPFNARAEMGGASTDDLAGKIKVSRSVVLKVELVN